MRHETSLELLERVRDIYNRWIIPGHNNGNNTHNVSCTVSVKEDEWEEVGKWMWSNREYYNGLSVLPYFGGSYKQAPFEDIDETTFKGLFDNLKEELTIFYIYIISEIFFFLLSEAEIWKIFTR